MARPKTVKYGVKLNLFLPRDAKRALFHSATEDGKSLSAKVTELILADQVARKRAAQDLQTNPMLPGIPTERAA